MAETYQEQDEALDEEIKALYAPESPDESGTEEEPEQEIEEEEEPEAEDGTSEEPEEEIKEEAQTVPESRYRESVVAMNKAQQELAERRKQDAQRDGQIQQLEAQIQELTAKLKQEDSTPKKEVGELDELSEARELFPEVIDPLTRIIGDLRKEIADLKKDSGEFKGVTERLRNTEQLTAQEKHWNAIREQHPDVEQIADDPEFEAWRSKQPPLIQYALDKGSAPDVVLALNLYKQSLPKEDERPSKPDKLEAARKAATPSIKTTSKPSKAPTFTTDQIAKMPMDEFRKHEAAIDEALARGEIM